MDLVVGVLAQQLLESILSELVEYASVFLLKGQIKLPLFFVIVSVAADVDNFRLFRKNLLQGFEVHSLFPHQERLLARLNNLLDLPKLLIRVQWLVNGD